MDRSSDETASLQEGRLREAVMKAYADARREVFDLGWTENHPDLSNRQRFFLDALAQAEDQLTRHRRGSRESLRLDSA